MSSFMDIPSSPLGISEWCAGPVMRIKSSLTSVVELGAPKSPASCLAENLREGFSCEEASETTQLQAPHSLSYNGSLGEKEKERKRDRVKKSSRRRRRKELSTCGNLLRFQETAGKEQRYAQ